MNDQQGITDDLGQAVDELHAALTSAADATARIKALLPRVSRISSVFTELESIIESGRQTAGVAAAARPALAPASPSAPRTRPTLVAPSTPTSPQRSARPKAAAASPSTPVKPAERAEAAGTPQPPVWAPATLAALAAKPAERPQPPIAPPMAGLVAAASAELPDIAAANEPMTSFRLEFESTHGPLDLRAVDDAVNEHPAVRDVALLDYDGRRATLKVWIVESASVADVQQSLTARAARLAAPGGDISIIALEDVA